MGWPVRGGGGLAEAAPNRGGGMSEQKLKIIGKIKIVRVKKVDVLKEKIRGWSSLWKEPIIGCGGKDK